MALEACISTPNPIHDQHIPSRAFLDQFDLSRGVVVGTRCEFPCALFLRLFCDWWEDSGDRHHRIILLSLRQKLLGAAPDFPRDRCKSEVTWSCSDSRSDGPDHRQKKKKNQIRLQRFRTGNARRIIFCCSSRRSTSPLLLHLFSKEPSIRSL